MGSGVASMGAVKAMQAVRVSALESGDIGLDELNTQADVAAAVSQTDVMEEAAFRSDGPQCAHVCTRVESPARNSGADRAAVMAGRPASAVAELEAKQSRGQSSYKRTTLRVLAYI